MKAILVATLALVAVCSFGQVVTVAEFSHPPFAYLDEKTQEPRGAEVAFLTAVLKEAGYTAKFTMVPFPRLLSSLQDGSFDMGSFLTRTPEREATIDFSDSPVLEMAPVVVVRMDSSLQQLTSVSELASFKVGFVDKQALPGFFGAPESLKLDLVSGDDPTGINLKKLTAKRIDAMIDLNRYNVLLDIKALGLKDGVRVLTVPTQGVRFFVTASKKSKNAESVLKSLNAVLKTGKYDLKTFLEAELK